MSAYVVSPKTIDLIVSAAQRFCKGSSFYGKADARDGLSHDHVSPHSAAQELGSMLWNENQHSVNFRYCLTEGEECAPYTFAHVDLDHACAGIDPAILVLGSVRCLRYQSCEASDYAETNACKLLNWIESACISNLINTHDAPWGWTPDWTNERRSAVKARIAVEMGLRQ